MLKVGIVGYGNLGKGVLKAVSLCKDVKCVGVFTRRDPKSLVLDGGVKSLSVNDLSKYKGKIDVLINCGGSATDLPITSPEFLKDFNVVDSFDTHAKIPEHYKKLNSIGNKHNTLALLSGGWDPGLFSMARLLFSSVLPNGKDYTFWGKGVSQGHSDAIRRIKGVKNAIQYTVPIKKALDSVRNFENPTLSAGEKHNRECYVSLEENADKNLIEQEIKNMPNYFKDYNTIVHFVSNEKVIELQKKLNHGGLVIRTGKTTEENNHILEFSLKLDSNPEFTGSVILALARAVFRLNKEGKKGAVTVFDIPLSYMSDLSDEYLREHLL